MLHILLWKWHQQGFRCPYGAEHVNIMVHQLRRNLTIPYRALCVTDDADGVECESFPLWSDHKALRNASGPHLPSCYRRLRVFDTATQKSMGIVDGDRVVSLDLDTIICQNIDSLFLRNEPYVGWAVPGARHEKVYNGSMFMFAAGQFDWLWQEFDAHKSPFETAKKGFFGSDQAYLSQKLLEFDLVGDWTTNDGVLSYPRDIRSICKLPAYTRMVMFHGRAKPWDDFVMKQSPWVTRYWRMDECKSLQTA